MDVYDLPKLADPLLVVHVQHRHAYREAGCPKVCPRCGGRHQGLRLPMCTDPGWDHQETCVTYRYADDVCSACDLDMELSKQGVS